MAVEVPSRVYKVLALGSTWSFGVVFLILSFIMYQITYGAYWAIYNLIAMLVLGFFMFLTGAWVTIDRRYILNKITDVFTVEQIWLGRFRRVVRELPIPAISHLSETLTNYDYSKGLVFELWLYKKGEPVRSAFVVFRTGFSKGKIADDFARWLATRLNCEYYPAKK